MLLDAVCSTYHIYFILQDAKEHLAALADKLGPSLADIDVWRF